MEKLHKSELRPWISDKINLKEFRDKWCNENSSKSVYHWKDDEYSIIENECGADMLKCSVQPDMEMCEELLLPLDIKLETLRCQREDLAARKQDSVLESLRAKELRRFNNYPQAKLTSDLQASEEPFEKIQLQDIMLCVQVYRPEKKVGTFQRGSGQRNPGFTIQQEFMVLGSQCLTELRDKIMCVSDEAVIGDYSENPTLPPETRCKDIYKSGFFFINGTFYNDMRHQDCRDYSQNLIKWTESQTRGMGPFKKSSMENTCFIDLTLQLGYPYVYIHQGNCEHLLVFSDILMHTSHFKQNRNHYPLPLAIRTKKRNMCMICQLHTAEWCVLENELLPVNPYFLCKKCFFSFNYDENNKKVGKFKAYHYVDRSNIA